MPRFRWFAIVVTGPEGGTARHSLHVSEEEAKVLAGWLEEEP